MGILYSLRARKRIVRMEPGIYLNGRKGTWVTYADGKKKFKKFKKSKKTEKIKDNYKQEL